jgi:hypothetical protein
MKTVKFIKPYSPYAVGDIAGLTDKEARIAIQEEVAEEYKPKNEKKTLEDAPVNKMATEPEIKK